MRLRCEECVAAQDPAKEVRVLLVTPTLFYRIGEWLRLCAAMIVLGAVVLGATAAVGHIGNYFLGEWFASILFLLAFVFCACLLIVPFHMLPDIWRNLDFGEVSNWRAGRNLVFASSGSAKFHDLSVALHEVKQVAVKQSWIGRLLGFGNVFLYKTPGGEPAMRYYGIPDPAGFARGIEALIERAPVLPKPPPAEAPAGEPQPSPSWLDKAKGAAEKLAGFAVPIVIAGGLMFASWWWWSQHELTMAPGESREIPMRGLGVVATRPVTWTSQDTDDLRMGISAPPGVEVTFLSASVATDKLAKGSGTQINIEYRIRVRVAPDVRPGKAEIYLRFLHPKLGPPAVSPPVEKLRLKIG